MAAGGGVQPSELFTASQHAWGADNVTQMQNGTLENVADAMGKGFGVIVDIGVWAEYEYDEDRSVESYISNSFAEPATTDDLMQHIPSFAHFARVLGVDLTKREIYLTASFGKSNYWTLTEEGYTFASSNPEQSIRQPAPNAELVNQWLLIINPGD